MKSIKKLWGNIPTGGLFFLLVMLIGNNSMAQNPTIINDSLVVNNRVYAKEKLIVDQEAKFKQDIKVLGSARIQTDLRVDSILRVDGTAKFFGNVKMEGLGNVLDLDSTSKIVVILPNGQLKTIDIPGLINGVYSKDEPCKSITPSHPFPVWAHGVNKIFANYCSPINVGIGTSTPLHNLDVRGVTFSTKILAGNVDAPTTELINGYAPNNSWDLMKLGVKFGALTEEVRFRMRNNG